MPTSKLKTKPWMTDVKTSLRVNLKVKQKVVLIIKASLKVTFLFKSTAKFRPPCYGYFYTPKSGKFDIKYFCTPQHRRVRPQTA